MINVDTIQQEIEQEEQLNKIDDMSGEANPYREDSKQCREDRATVDTNGAVVNSKQCSELHPAWQTPYNKPQFKHKTSK